MTPWQWATRPIRQYVQFEGRSPRPEYWWFMLLWTAIAVVTLAIDALLLGAQGPDDFSPLFLLACALLLLPHLGVTVRRYHDIGKRGWWALLFLVPYVGWLWVVIDMATAGETDENRFGEPPYGRMDSAAPPAAPVIRS